jgi:hypothetical protein
MKVDKVRFARLLGIKTIDGSLFHKQGNFPSHGFLEMAPDEARCLLPSALLEGVDFDRVRLMTHEPGDFFKGCGLEILRKCRWFNGRRKERENEEEEVVLESIF